MNNPVTSPLVLKAGCAGLAAMLFLSVQVNISAQQTHAAPAPHPTASQKQFLDRYCATCHGERLKTGGLNLAAADVSTVPGEPELWEKVARKLHAGVMPPPAAPQPSESD